MEINTPAILLDESRCRQNIKVMINKASAKGLILRPHFKTHQSLRIGRWFREYGLEKICVSSVSMAKYFSEDGWKDILIAFPFNPGELALIKELAEKINLSICVPGPESAEILKARCDFDINIFIKVDTGYGRSGTMWNDTERLNKTYNILNTFKHTSVKGLMTHAGNTYKARSRKKIEEISELSISRLHAARESIGDHSLILSAGDTPSASVCNNFGEIDELRPGNFVFYDLMQYFIGSCSLEQVAVVVSCPVVDISKKNGKVVIYGGGIHFSKEYVETKARKVYGLLVKAAGDKWEIPADRIYVESLSQEHGIIRFDNGVPDKLLIGDLLYIIPVHSCLTAEAIGNYLLTDGTVADHMQIKYRNKL